MSNLIINPAIKEKIPTFKIGYIFYKNITVGDSPQMLKGRLAMFQEKIQLDLEENALSEIDGISKWRQIFKKLGMDPSRYRPSSEALYRRIQKGNFLQSIHSAVDVNNFFSLQYEIPLGIYDLDQIVSPIEIRLGKDTDYYDGINEREMLMANKLITADQTGAFGSPIVDSKRTMVTEQTKNALHVIYLKDSMPTTEANELLSAVARMFTQIHGGDFEFEVVE